MKKNPGKILFSIDLEEFDIPEEYGKLLPLATKLEVSLEGMRSLEALMDKYDITSTIFTTAFWAQHHPDYMRTLAARHEIASHTFYHNKFCTEDLRTSRQVLSSICNKEITGLRMPLMQDIDHDAVAAAGYTYDSSLHPTLLPGRYNHFKAQRTLHRKDNLWILPASVTPVWRIPVFWLTLKNLPLGWYKRLCRNILQQDGYLVLYVHPWEFTDLSLYALPPLIKRKDGAHLLHRLEQVFSFFRQEGCSFATHEMLVKEQMMHVNS